MKYGSYDVRHPRFLRDEWHSMWVGLGFVTGLILFGIYVTTRPAAPVKIISPVPEATPTPTVTPTPIQKPATGQHTGIASYYSRAGCVGCSKTLTMANGEPLDDSKLTLAHNQIPLNTMVEVINKRNGKKAIAKVTDRGGFNKYNRIADLSLALAQAIDLKTDVDILTITPVK